MADLTPKEHFAACDANHQLLPMNKTMTFRLPAPMFAALQSYAMTHKVDTSVLVRCLIKEAGASYGIRTTLS
jgi:hypothetical protein